MKVKLNQAVKMFFGNSSLEMVYSEAIANALDANATKIDIEIFANSLSKSETIRIVIKDNGEGFTDKRFGKFCRLFDVDESSHKGLGRLVYPFYFENIHISSFYEDVYHREFTFDENLNEDGSTVTKVDKTDSGTTISMDGYTLSRLRQGTFIQSDFLKQRMLEEFYPRFYKLKKEEKHIEINIKSTIENSSITRTISTKEIPDLKLLEINQSLNLIDKFYLYYIIEETPQEPSKIISAVSVDNRTQKVDIVAEENLPIGYNMVFLLFSDWFIGKVDLTRQALSISDADKQAIQKLFRSKVTEIITLEIPQIVRRNQEIRQNVVNLYPHLSGYFSENEIGYVSYNELIKDAQDKFFKAQRKILEANNLTDDQFNESIELSSRALTEYILFRQITIDKLKKINKKNNEADIHNLIVPQYKQLNQKNRTEDLYYNNAWILDDKYMTYKTILSDKEMSEIVDVITEGEYKEEDSGQPDIALIFSNDPNSEQAVDVVIVELKKKGITLDKTMVVETQLKSRATKLMKHYGNRIQRIWFYGIIEFTDEIELHLRSEYKQLYSTGKMYYKPSSAVTQLEPEIRLPIGIFMMDLDSVVNDADARNSTFLNLIKSKFNQA